MSRNISTLVGRSLAQFTLKRWTEVYTVDGDGKKTSSYGIFKNEKLARVFIEAQDNSDGFRAGPVLVLTDHKEAFILEWSESAEIIDEAKLRANLRKKILNKLSPRQRLFLKLR